MPTVEIIRDLCKGCELCITACPQNVLEMSKDFNLKGYFYSKVSRPHQCIGCRICGITCPDVAIEVKVHGAQYVFFDY